MSDEQLASCIAAVLFSLIFHWPELDSASRSSLGHATVQDGQVNLGWARWLWTNIVVPAGVGLNHASQSCTFGRH